MTQSTETVSQRAREAAADTYVSDHPKREETALTHSIRRGGLDRNSRVQSFASFERELSTNKDETIAKLLIEALGEIEPAKRYAEECGLEGGKLPSAVHIKLDMIAGHIRDAIALTSTKKEGCVMTAYMVSYQTDRGNACTRQIADGKKHACRLVKERISGSFAHHAEKLHD